MPTLAASDEEVSMAKPALGVEVAAIIVSVMVGRDKAAVAVESLKVPGWQTA